MAKKSVSEYKMQNVSNNVRWEKKLPSTYETILTGFHAKMTVAEMVAYFKLNDVKVPEAIKDVKIGSFSPAMFEHEKFAGFWKKPLTMPNMKNDYPEVHKALTEDPHIKSKEMQKAVGYRINETYPSLRDLACLAQLQFLGFNLRMGELTSKNLYARIEKLRDPEYYQELLNSPFVKKHDLKNNLPNKMPEFKISGEEFSVKQIRSAITKAYTRSGKPDSLEEFLEEPNKYGVFAVSDMQRTMLRPVMKGHVTAEEREAAHTDLSNVLAVALMSGDLGVVPKEITDSLHYPPSARASDLYPITMTKGKMRHEGPNGSYLSTYAEIQVVYVPDYAIKTTHDMYENSRSLTNQVAKKNAENSRIEVINSFIPEKTIEERQEYLATKTVDPSHKIAKLFQGVSADLLSDQHARRRALGVACREFGDVISQGKNSIEKLDFDKLDTEIIKQALRDMIRRPTDENREAVTREIGTHSVESRKNNIA